jgi:hypothetical protein
LCLQHILCAALLRRAIAQSTSFVLAVARRTADCNEKLQPLLLMLAQGCFTLTPFSSLKRELTSQ